MVLEPGREEDRKQGAAYPCDKPRHERDGERMSPHVLLPFRPARVNGVGRGVFDRRDAQDLTRLVLLMA